MKLVDYLRPEYIELGILARSKEELLDRMIALAARNPQVLDKAAMGKAIIDREQIMSTGGVSCTESRSGYLCVYVSMAAQTISLFV